MWKLFITLFLVPYTVYCDIYQASDINEPALVRFNMQVTGGKSQCTPLLAEGNLTFVNTSLYFNGGSISSTYAADMFFLVKELTSSSNTTTTTRCIQYGGWDYIEPTCTRLNKWPSSWNKHKTGWYNYTANVTIALFSSNSWEICVGNGYVGSIGGYPESYSGYLLFPDSLVTIGIPPTGSPTSLPTNTPTISFQPTSLPTGLPSSNPTPFIAPSAAPSSIPSHSHAPTTTQWILSSDCQTPVVLDYQVSLAGTEYSCHNFPAKGQLHFVNISLYFSGSTSQEWAYDMALVVKHTTGTGIQIGGFDGYKIENVTFVGVWPSSWRSADTGWYYANINVTQYEVEGQGEYNICLVNAWSQAKQVNYDGSVLLNGLITDCTPSPSSIPTPGPSIVEWEFESDCNEVVSIDYDLRLSGYETSCYTYTAKGLIQFVNMSLYFSGSINGEYPADLSLTVSIDGGNSFMIGGFDDTENSVNYLGSWPPSWRSELTGYYYALINVTSVQMISSGENQICISNGWQYAHSVNYDGDVQLIGEKRLCDKKKSNSNDDDEDNQMAIALGLSIPLILISLAIGGYFFVRYLQTQKKGKEALLSGNTSSDISKNTGESKSSSYSPPQPAFRADSNTGL